MAHRFEAIVESVSSWGATICAYHVKAKTGKGFARRMNSLPPIRYQFRMRCYLYGVERSAMTADNGYNLVLADGCILNSRYNSGMIVR